MAADEYFLAGQGDLVLRLAFRAFLLQLQQAVQFADTREMVRAFGATPDIHGRVLGHSL